MWRVIGQKADELMRILWDRPGWRSTLSGKSPVQALKIFLRRPDAFPDKSGPTERYTTR
jgi:uncharacterized protein with WD repeat